MKTQRLNAPDSQALTPKQTPADTGLAGDPSYEAGRAMHAAVVGGSTNNWEARQPDSFAVLPYVSHDLRAAMLDMWSVCLEAACHLYTKQDMDRVRQMARDTITKAERA